MILSLLGRRHESCKFPQFPKGCFTFAQPIGIKMRKSGFLGQNRTSETDDGAIPGKNGFLEIKNRRILEFFT